jgi:uncharacterized integral membrane protein
MELEDLKKDWQKSGFPRESSRDILEMIHHRSEGPAAKLQRRFRKGMILAPVILAVMIIRLSGKKLTLTSDFFFCYFAAFCVFITLYFFVNYRLVSKMQDMDEAVRSNLEKQVSLLEKGVRWRLIITRMFFLLLPVLFEVMIHISAEPSFSSWLGRPWPVRVLAYAVGLALFFTLISFAIRTRYGRQITRLKELVAQLREA